MFGLFHFADVSPCLNSPCQNEGNCTDIGIHMYSCTCPKNYFGQNCQSELGSKKKPWLKILHCICVKVCPWCGVGLLRYCFVLCGVINKLTLLLVSAAPVKRKGARGEVRFPETPLLCALFYLKGPAPCYYWLAVT